MKLELADAELRAVIMDKLAKRNCWGAKYLLPGYAGQLARQEPQKKRKKSEGRH